MVEQRIAARGIPIERYEERFDARSALLARTLVLVMVPVLALSLAAVLARRRFPFGHHLVFATHFYAFELLFAASLFLLCWSLLLEGLARSGLLNVYALRGQSGLLGMIGVLAIEFPTFLVVLPYVYMAARRAYTLGRTGAILLALFVCLATMPIILLYRLLLFWLTFASV